MPEPFWNRFLLLSECYRSVLVLFRTERLDVPFWNVPEPFQWRVWTLSVPERFLVNYLVQSLLTRVFTYILCHILSIKYHCLWSASNKKLCFTSFVYTTPFLSSRNTCKYFRYPPILIKLLIQNGSNVLQCELVLELFTGTVPMERFSVWTGYKILRTILGLPSHVSIAGMHSLAGTLPVGLLAKYMYKQLIFVRNTLSSPRWCHS